MIWELLDGLLWLLAGVTIGIVCGLLITGGTI